jgi:hypothetical protein
LRDNNMSDRRAIGDRGEEGGNNEDDEEEEK